MPFKHKKQFVIEHHFQANEGTTADLNENKITPGTGPIELLGRRTFKYTYCDLRFFKMEIDNEEEDDDTSPHLMNQGILVCQRDEKTSAKIHCCGDELAGRYREISGERVFTYVNVANSRANSRLAEAVDICTRQNKWRAGPYDIIIDEVKHLIGYIVINVETWRPTNVIGRVERRQNVKEGQEKDLWKEVVREMKNFLRKHKLCFKRDEVMSWEEYVHKGIKVKSDHDQFLERYANNGRNS